MHPRTLYLSAAALLAITLTGCPEGATGGASKEKVNKVTGKVTMAGAPVASAFVTFSPAGKQPAATAKTDTAGQYVLTTYDAGDGAVAGEYTVVVTKEGAAPAAAGGAPTGHDPKNVKPQAGPRSHDAAGPGGAAAGGLLPIKYSSVQTSDLKVTVKEGSNDIPLELKP